MKSFTRRFDALVEYFWNKTGLGMQSKLIIIFLVVKVIPLIVLVAIAWRQITVLGVQLREIAVSDSSAALNDSAVENIERLSTDTARDVADFLYARDDDILYVAGLAPDLELYRDFVESKTGRLVEKGEWQLAEDGKSWVPVNPPEPAAAGGASTNQENNDMDGFHYRYPDTFTYQSVPLYDEITFLDLNGNELVKYVSPSSTKKNYRLSPELRDVSKRENTYVKAETYFPKLRELKPGEIYVSDVTGAYVGSNYIGMYAPEIVGAVANERGYDIPFTPEEQAYAGKENPNGRRFEGIVRWAAPVTDGAGAVVGYVTLALNHDHIMEFVDHITPMNERYTDLPSAYEGNYAFIWDYQCRSICHPRHHSIVGFNPDTGDPEIPWLETSIYEAWQASDVEDWMDFVRDIPTFDDQSRKKKPAPELTQAGLVGLDGRYLNNAPQCTGWMDLTGEGGSGSFYILWSGLYKLNTAAAIPYYTGQYAPSEENDYSLRGFGFVAIGAGMEDFTGPARATEEKLTAAIGSNLTATFWKLTVTTTTILILVVLIAIGMASALTGNITSLIAGISRFREGERQFRFDSTARDEFRTLADSFDDMADSVVDSVKNALSITDMDRNIIYMNDYGLEFCKMSLDDIVGTSYGESSVYPANSRYCPITALEEGRESDVYFDRSSGRYIRGSANYFVSKDGEKIGYIVETIDVTDMVREQIKLEEQRSLLDKIFSASPDLIWYVDAKGEYLAVNPRFAAIAGATPDEFIGKTPQEMLPGALSNVFRENDAKAIAASRPLYTEDNVTFADGHQEVLDSVHTPIHDINGTLTGLLGYARNVTTRVKIENELRKTQVDLEQAVSDANRANEHKGEFLARMSHEIRTPMNAIIGVTNIVQRKLSAGAGDVGEMEEIMEHVCQIEASSQHLLGLLNDILDISKIEAGKIELLEETVELTRLLNTVVGIIRPRCDEKNITFETRFDELLPSTFLCDSLRLRQVLINLLGNAVKFTPELGQITFRVTKKGRRDGRTQLEFLVSDTGIGISDEAMAAIFQPFEQGDGKITRQFGGTGLGLSISRRIVELFGGEIAVSSRLGEGSAFSFVVWLQETESDLPHEAAAADATNKFTGKKALLVDDVEINRVIVMSMLEETDMEIDEAEDGIAAVEAFKASPEHNYDVIFMDIQMPNMDGYEASKIIRGLDRADAGSVPIIALTANAFQDDINKALNHGMNAHVTKPVEVDKLIEVLLRIFGRR